MSKSVETQSPTNAKTLKPTMQNLFAQLSGLLGVFVFLQGLWSYAPLDQSIFTAFASAFALYLVLTLGGVTISRILAQKPIFANEGPALDSAKEMSSAKSEASDES